MVAIDTYIDHSIQPEDNSCLAPEYGIQYQPMVCNIETTATRYYQDSDFNPNDWVRQFGKESFYQSILCRDFLPLITDVNKMPSILDIGFGPGKEMDLLLNTYPSLKYFGVDFSSSFIQFAMSKIDKSYIGRRLQRFSESCLLRPIIVQADALRLPFQSNSFDAVMVLALMHHIDYCHAQDMIRDISNILRLKGKAIFSIREGSGPERASNGMMYARYTRSEFIDVLHKGGFEIINAPKELLSTSEVYKNIPYTVYLVENRKCLSIEHDIHI